MTQQPKSNLLRDEIKTFIHSRHSLNLSTLDAEGNPYASYAPFAYDDNHFYMLLSDVALHALHLVKHPYASCLIIEDEDTADQLFARVRINYRLVATLLPFETKEWADGLAKLEDRHGATITHLAKHSDFKLFKFAVRDGRYIKGFGQAFALGEGSLFNSDVDHMRDGHTKRKPQDNASI